MKKMIKNSRIRKVLTSVLIITGLIVGAASVYAAFLYNKLNQTLDHIAAPEVTTATNLNGESIAPVTQATNPIEKPLTFLLTAIDEREGNEGSLNTDVMMLFSINPKSHQGTVVSIPRDLEIEADKSGLDGSHKANYFYAYYYNKNKDTALYETKRLFSDVYQVPIDYMAVINFEGFRKLIDQLGGMTVEVDMNMRYQDESDGTDIHLNKGKQQLNGKQVLDFIRYRKSNLGTAESSDMERNQREQLVLNQLLDQLTTLNGLTAWAGVLDIIGGSIKTDIPVDELRTLTKSYRDLKPATVRYIQLKGEWESPYLVVNQRDLEEALGALRRQQSGEPIDSQLRTD
ncbi:LCP family protein required for cell wall assembly [Paenibacillus sp. V4I3]|uniref:LCP family protein n=1 Tax=Paenibacillus sp. V4I3 TaxID=3042305 RepID=UPI00278A034A|nr:LCP family protein [Paenibacillus sp. V4I3]MDQ0875148.1 LCP family protein required for cell wall assembly [Paenibacillus sp. V4I3]